ncbi:ornithine carbamoyltransferase [Aeropyrum camini]|uniref:Ornithine carbamoyltransferase n=1 Tax=Aeropyrum camini SY1 = JCM 12091 TaxID=1198449 RepID=U3TFA8_9CREN|nr:ornithine carbamoyltransferase [Aeropyrum camini]BAN90720.1 ornithine carbamoyltransferase [Aeropyrum camini SY1 = JCM 12091]
MSLHRLKGRHLLWLADYTGEEIMHMIELTLEMKRRYYSGERVIPALRGRSVGLLFEKPSTRTRISLEVAVAQLGGHTVYMTPGETQLGRGETIADTARVLSRYLDAIVARVRSHATLEELARHASIPVINGLSDLTHPLQAIADMATILEKKGRLAGVKLAFVGDGADNVLHSLLLAGSKLGLHISVATPPEIRPDERILSKALEAARESGGSVEIVSDPYEAVREADVVYTDVWVSMGQESVAEEKVKLLKPYQVDARLMEAAGGGAIFMHCLPAKRGQEVTDEVIDGPWSVVWDQAENRLHAHKAVLSLLIP